MTEEDKRSQLANDILVELRALAERLARLERLMEKIAVGMGVAPHG